MSEEQKYTKPWFRRISRTVRPFKFSNEILANVQFRINDIEDYSDIESICISDINLDAINPSFKLHINEKEIEETLDLSIKDLNLIVSINDSVVKRIDLIFNENLEKLNLDSDDNYVIEIPPSEVIKYSWSNKTKITIALVLNESKETRLGKPYLKGHWLSRKDFSLVHTVNAPKFNFQVIKPEQFKDMGLPSDTCYYISINGDDLNMPREEFQEVIKVYISEPINNFLAKNDSNPHGKTLSHIIAYDLAATILSYGFSNLPEDHEIQENSILHAAAFNLSKEVGKDIREIKAWAKEPGATKLRSVYQSQMKLSKILLGKE
jgi:hypothetical protein